MGWRYNKHSLDSPVSREILLPISFNRLLAEELRTPRVSTAIGSKRLRLWRSVYSPSCVMRPPLLLHQSNHHSHVMQLLCIRQLNSQSYCLQVLLDYWNYKQVFWCMPIISHFRTFSAVFYHHTVGYEIGNMTVNISVIIRQWKLLYRDYWFCRWAISAK